MEDGLPADVPRLTRDRPAPPLGVVHLGVGAFFKAFGAIWLEDAMAASGGDWGVIGVSLRRPDERNKLAPQDYAYQAVELGPEGRQVRKVQMLRDILVAPEDPEAVLAVMADPAIRIVSLTVTEKGYTHSPATGRLDFAHPDILHDLEQPDAPRSAVGFLVRALDRRRRAGVRPFTVLCCDNLPSNGRMLRGLVLEFAERVDPSLAAWIAAEARFPSTMVDRIVPATTSADIERLAKETGLRDDGPVFHEPFRQWAIEDDFVDGVRPDFGAVGAQLTAEVEPFELMKLRCLNGTHSALAYLGYLSGHETVAEAVADPILASFVQRLWRTEILPSLIPPGGVDIEAYTADLLARYRNPAIRHRTWQIAMDGSQKLPQRILGTVGDNLSAERSVDGLATVVAAWMRYVGGTDEAGRPIDVRDPLADRLRALSNEAEGAEARAHALLSVREVFPEALAADPQFRDPVARSLASLETRGARFTLEALS
ncbi:mannitol dehydrogenase family protein [Rubellimicrobium rubrum]|uniref:Mannitol dehydrogenase family protein n=1 Tax=Rubellimicrobium rubrum TaxID=2585369 RepID=A0A5C4MP88_9RHOB|nr:mannitol dehydrogenase family protein [Rubellimicrobium rubrum]TNC47417.1 mannitol dehydrogenase family protein [Rubellimicrobium rubrum]